MRTGQLHTNLKRTLDRVTVNSELFNSGQVNRRQVISGQVNRGQVGRGQVNSGRLNWRKADRLTENIITTERLKADK